MRTVRFGAFPFFVLCAPFGIGSVGSPEMWSGDHSSNVSSRTLKPAPWATPEMRETARLVREVPRTRCEQPVWRAVWRSRQRMRV